MSPDLQAAVLRWTLMSLVTLAVMGLSWQMVRRPHRHRRHPMRRLMPRWFTGAAVALLVIGAVLALLGLSLLQEAPLSAEDLEDGRGMSISGIAMVLCGLVLLWIRIITFVEATPAGFVFRGVLGRTVSIPYGELTDLQTTSRNGAARVRVEGTGKRTFTAALGMFDWTYFDRWKAARLAQQRLFEEQRRWSEQLTDAEREALRRGAERERNLGGDLTGGESAGGDVPDGHGPRP